ncbi:hypothetical protein BH11MYX1_BH11MYX1_27680 [soil metagenome]
MKLTSSSRSKIRSSSASSNRTRFAGSSNRSRRLAFLHFSLKARGTREPSSSWGGSYAILDVGRLPLSSATRPQHRGDVEVGLGDREVGTPLKRRRRSLGSSRSRDIGFRRELTRAQDGLAERHQARTRSAQRSSDLDRAAHALFELVSRHLRLAILTPRQAERLERRDWRSTRGPGCLANALQSRASLSLWVTPARSRATFLANASIRRGHRGARVRALQ